jgi:hypothetical protein
MDILLRHARLDLQRRNARVDGIHRNNAHNLFILDPNDLLNLHPHL